MKPLARAAIAVAIYKAGSLLSDAAGDLVPLSRSHAGRLGLGMLEIAIGFATLALVLAWCLPGPVVDRLGLRRGRLPWPLVAAFVIGTLGLSHAIEGVVALTRADEGSVMQGIARSQRAARGGGLAIALLGSVLAPAVCEELLARGLVQRSLARWVGPGLAVVGATLFFGWMHKELAHGAVAATLGLYLGVIAWWADSTRPAMLAHGANNAMALLGSAGLIALPLPLWVSAPLGAALAGAALLVAALSQPIPRGATALPRDLQMKRESTDA